MNRTEQSGESQESVLLPLLAAMRGGSTETQNQLMRQLRTYFHLMARSELAPLLRRKIENSDVVQQSCIKVLEGIEQFRGTTEGELRNWLKRVLTNEINQVGRDLRAQKRDFRRDIPIEGHSGLGAHVMDDMLTPRSSALAQEQQDAVRDALAQLPEDYQQVIKMRSWGGMSFPQIAENIGKSINATEKLWYRAVQRLGKQLANYEL